MKEINEIQSFEDAKAEGLRYKDLCRAIDIVSVLGEKDVFDNENLIRVLTVKGRKVVEDLIKWGDTPPF